MNNIQKRFLLFLIGCIGLRTLLVKFVKDIDAKWLPYLGAISICISIGFIYVYISGSRTTGSEVFGDKIWWNSLRPFHAMMYLLFGINAIAMHNNAWWFLAVDVCVGLIAFLYYHYTEGSFSKLI